MFLPSGLKSQSKRALSTPPRPPSRRGRVMSDKFTASSGVDPSAKTISVPVFHLYHKLLPGTWRHAGLNVLAVVKDAARIVSVHLLLLRETKRSPPPVIAPPPRHKVNPSHRRWLWPSCWRCCTTASFHRATSPLTWPSNWAPRSSPIRACPRPTPSRGCAPREVPNPSSAGRISQVVQWAQHACILVGRCAAIVQCPLWRHRNNFWIKSNYCLEHTNSHSRLFCKGFIFIFNYLLHTFCRLLIIQNKTKQRPTVIVINKTQQHTSDKHAQP